MYQPPGISALELPSSHGSLKPQEHNIAGYIIGDSLSGNGETNYLGQPLVLLRIGSICVFDQTRDGRNPEQDALQDSIATRGLINAVDVVRLPRQAIVRYNDFVGELWGRKRDIADLPQSTHIPDMYDTLVAGHSRMTAIQDIEKTKAALFLDNGRIYNPGMAQIPASLHNATTPIEMLAIQINENIHKAPSQERVAVALVESYYLGIAEGLWKSPKDFLEQNGGRFSRRQLADAIAFVRLPEEVRALVTARSIPYSVGVALGEFSGTVEAYYRQRYFDGRERICLVEEQRMELDNLVESKLMFEAAFLLRKRMNVTAARKRYSSEKKAMLKAVLDDGSELTLDALFRQAAAEDIRRELRQNRESIQRMLDEMLGDTTMQLMDTQRRIRRYADSDTRVLNLFAEGTSRIAKAARDLLP